MYFRFNEKPRLFEYSTYCDVAAHDMSDIICGVESTFFRVAGGFLTL